MGCGGITHKRLKSKILIYIGIFAILTVFSFPVYWLFLSSFKDNSVLMRLPPDFSPFSGTLANYRKILSTAKYMIYFKNSVIVALVSVILSISVSIFAGYAFSRYSFRFKSLLMTLIINIQVFPVTVIIISLFGFYTKLGLINTYRGLILADIVYSLPFAVWFLKSFFDTIPRSLDEAASIDGCSRLRTLFYVIVPLVKTGILAVGIYTFLYSWDDYVFGLTIIKSESIKTLPVGIAQGFLGEYAHDYAGMMTLCAVTALPVVIAFILLQKYMVAGLTSGSVKG